MSEQQDKNQTYSNDYHGADRRTNGGVESLISSMPVWAKVVVILGPLPAMALGLVWLLATEVPKLSAMGRETIERDRQHIEQTTQHTEDTAAIFRMLQRICWNTAKDEAAREKCFDK